MTYQNNLPAAEITVHSPNGTTAVGCFWAKRDSQRVLKHVTPDVAVVGNIYHNRFVTPYLMQLSAHKVARALWWNPQITEMVLVSADPVEIRDFAEALRTHELVSYWESDGRDTNSATVMLYMDREKRDYPLPPVSVPDTFPYKYSTGHSLRGDNLTELHGDLLRHTLRYGVETKWEEKTRLELLGTQAEWRAPFSLGRAYESFKPAWLEYAHLLPDGVQPGQTTEEESVEYTYASRLGLGFNDHYGGQLDRGNYYPVWIPSDHNHSDQPCLVGVYLRRRVAFGIFRAHNFMDAWPKNMFLVKTFAEEKSKDSLDAVVLVSLQGGIRPEDTGRAREYLEEYHPEGRPDVHGTGGSWIFCRDQDQGVAQILGPTGILQEFRGKSSLEIREQITALGAWPADFSECAYIGDQLRGLFQ